MSDLLRRRAFIALLGGAAICPFAARAENSDAVRRVGVIMGFAENDEVWQAYLASFRQGLHELGWTDGRNIRFDYRFTGESEERMRVAGHKPRRSAGSAPAEVRACDQSQNRRCARPGRAQFTPIARRQRD